MTDKAMTGVGSSGRKPYGGRAHQSHCSCSYELERLRAELQAREAAVLRMEAVVEAARAFVVPERRLSFWSDFLALSDALDAVPRRAASADIPHTHALLVPGCFRCELAEDEVEDELRAASPEVAE